MTRCLYGNHIEGSQKGCPGCERFNRKFRTRAPLRQEIRSQQRPERRRKPYYYNPADRD